MAAEDLLQEDMVTPEVSRTPFEVNQWVAKDTTEEEVDLVVSTPLPISEVNLTLRTEEIFRDIFEVNRAKDLYCLTPISGERLEVRASGENLSCLPRTPASANHI